MMPETNQIAIRRQLAKDAASETIKSLFTVYWANSFDVNRLQDRLVDLIFFFTRNAQALEEPHPSSERLSGSSNPITPSQEIPDHEL
ncbi:MAG: hypothetical protein IGS54_02150 [Elainella sp. C42_A2020_010]|nr:hypothetical protein [Elainella sp. C42_A2020_010]